MTEESRTVRILFVSDVVGKPGRRVLKGHLPDLLADHRVDFCVANGENAAGGVGLTADVADELFSLGIHVLTSGNHVWSKREIFDLIPHEPRILRPANYPPGTPGRGARVYDAASGVRVGVLNLFGRVFIPFGLDCPFRIGTEQVEKLRGETPIIL
ncbi:MAG: YmdB family metallophosphoesterase, partial [Nitrospinota bacterium]